LKELTELYEELDREIAQFKITAELDCIKFCHKCCATEGGKIEVSAFECLPLSIHLWQTEKAEIYLQKIGEANIKDPCVLYNVDRPRPDEWGCKYYPRRPLICRLFGFSAILDKRGEPKIALCRPIKEADPEAEKRINQRIAQGLKAPVLSHLARKASFLNPNLGQRRYPMNQGLKIALERLGFQYDLIKNGKGSKDSPLGNRNDYGSAPLNREDP
jgi:Fe-S-cluster containining protein